MIVLDSKRCGNPKVLSKNHLKKEFENFKSWQKIHTLIARFHVGYEIELPLVGLNDLKKV